VPVQILVTFLCVAVSLVFFKATSLEQALVVMAALVGAGTEDSWFQLNYRLDTIVVLMALVIVWGLPNTQQWVGLADTKAQPAVTRWPAWLGWRPKPAYGLVVGAILCLALLRNFGSAPAEFLYFAF
jgi:alginate O-acetyltransferase complex protein AlgI